jgi:hemerythrin-like domain-containing protein
MSNPSTNAAGTRTRAETETLLVHRVLRRATSLLAVGEEQVTIPPEQVLRLRDFVVSVVRHHHEREDQDLWPLLIAGDPSAAGPLSTLTHEHETLEAALEAFESVQLTAQTDHSSRAKCARGVRDLLAAHFR